MSDEITAGDVARQIQRGTFGWLTRLVVGLATLALVSALVVQSSNAAFTD
jgi:hypothetical protein